MEGLCICPHDRFGTDCEFTNVCPKLALNGKFNPFPSLKLYAISDEFHMLQSTVTGHFVRVYNMPVYYSNKTHPANIIFFGGCRWTLTDETGLFNLTSAMTENPSQKYFPQRTAAVLESRFFHGHYQAFFWVTQLILKHRIFCLLQPALGGQQ